MAETRRVDTGIIQRGSSYTFTVSMGMDSNGKQIRKTTTFKPPENLTQKKSDKLAKEEYVRFKERCTGLTAYSGNIKFSDLCDQYIKLYSKNVKPSTMMRYVSIINNYILPAFGNKKVKDITSATITKFLADVYDEKQLKASTVHNLYTVLTSIFKFSIRMDLIDKSPCSGVIVPKDTALVEKKPNRPLTFAELPEFCSYFQKNLTIDVMVLLLLHTGLRIGELIGLLWTDVDFDNKKLYIRHNLIFSKEGKNLSTPKTKSSIRTLSLSDTCIDLFTQQKRLSSWINNPKNLVFPNRAGEYQNQSYLSHMMHYRLKGTKFEDITPHGLRHTCATLLLNSGVDIKIVSEHLGHADVRTTANIYVDVLETTHNKTANLMEDILLQI